VTEVAGVPALTETARDDEVRGLLDRVEQQLLEDLRRVLEVGVHHADPVRGGRPHALDHRTAETANTVFGCPVDQVHVDLRLDCADHVRRIVIRVVDEDDLDPLMRDRQARGNALDALDERGDVPRLVAGRNDYREPRRFLSGLPRNGSQG
jgi:hypothetical protein